jgi:hypothetical protein
MPYWFNKFFLFLKVHSCYRISKENFIIIIIFFFIYLFKLQMGFYPVAVVIQ